MWRTVSNVFINRSLVATTFQTEAIDHTMLEKNMDLIKYDTQMEVLGFGASTTPLLRRADWTFVLTLLGLRYGLRCLKGLGGSTEGKVANVMCVWHWSEKKLISNDRVRKTPKGADVRGIPRTACMTMARG